MGTMLCYITTDCAISAPMLKKALLTAADASFHCISVDGDTSTNDSCVILANGAAGNALIENADAAYGVFLDALTAVCVTLAKKMAADGEGANHLVTCAVKDAASSKQAAVIAKSVIGSSLVKAAMFGADANWGRVLCAMGYSGESFDPDGVDVAFSSAAGRIVVCEGGRGLDFDEELAKKILLEKEIVIEISMSEGGADACAWGCDLSYDYVKINGDYRT
ncbi:MAG: bifunctional ornithine acetyltransferase/N-acetylglutamate synthase, partial [Oscillospiraceae bacterium]|nr:bifunctional ornithine acetyltransferase/N-acetylglutamate synthase [Oscillospiraceae bacterium]